MSHNDQAQEIRRQMDHIRRDMRVEMDDIVQNARVLSDWRFYVRSYPWVCLAAAAGLGYMVVPRRLEVVSPDATTLEQLAKKHRLVVKPDTEPQEKKSMVNKLVTFAASMALRGALAYAGQAVGKFVGTEAAAATDERNRSRPGAPR